MCKCVNVQTYDWLEANGTPRKAFRTEWEELNPNPLDRVLGLLRNKFVTLFGNNAECDQAFAELVEKNAVPNAMIMSYEQEVKPYCRAYSQASKNHQAGDLIMDETTGKPRLYTTIIVHCRSIMSQEGKEVPMNMSEVIRLANNQRDYFINNDDSNGIRRYYEPADVMGIDNLPEDIDDAADAPIEAFAPAQATQPTKPAAPVQPAAPAQPARPVQPRR